MADTSKYQWDTKSGVVKFGGSVGSVRVDTSALDALVAALPEMMSGVVLKVGEDTALLTAERAPVDTGELRDSYLSESEMVSDFTYRIQDGGEVPHGIYNELGTHKMAARPHLVPSVEEAERKLIDEIKAVFV